MAPTNHHASQQKIYLGRGSERSTEYTLLAIKKFPKLAINARPTHEIQTKPTNQPTNQPKKESLVSLVNYTNQ
ncbi:hypothetical protein PP707_05865 [Acetobacter pasteurianus]|nr:hypothetical protein [Acetobacter pasteurianus]